MHIYVYTYDQKQGIHARMGLARRITLGSMPTGMARRVVSGSMPTGLARRVTSDSIPMPPIKYNKYLDVYSSRVLLQGLCFYTLELIESFNPRLGGYTLWVHLLGALHDSSR